MYNKQKLKVVVKVSSNPSSVQLGKLIMRVWGVDISIFKQMRPQNTMIHSSVDSIGFATCHVAICHGENQKDGVSVNSRVVNTSNRVKCFTTSQHCWLHMPRSCSFLCCTLHWLLFDCYIQAVSHVSAYTFTVYVVYFHKKEEDMFASRLDSIDTPRSLPLRPDKSLTETTDLFVGFSAHVGVQLNLVWDHFIYG